MSGLIFDEQWLADYERRTGRKAKGHKRPPAAHAAEDKPPAKKSKYRAQPTMLDGKRYASKREAQRAAELKVLWQAREIAGYAEQVEFLLPGGIRYRADFVVLKKDGAYEIEDTKGFQTKEYRLKKKLMAEAGLMIKEI